MTEHPRTGVGAPDSGNGGTDHPTVQLPPVPSVGAPPAAAGGETPTRSVAGFRTQRLDPTAYGAYYSGPDEGPASPAERPPYRLEPVPHTPYPELATTTLLRPVKPPPSEGWRRLLYLLSGRLINAGADDYTRTLDILERFYGLVLTDCGTGLLHSAMSAVLPRSDVLVVVSSGSIDGARSAAATLDWLQAHGHDDQVRNSIAVVNAVRPRAGKVDVGKVVEHFSRRCRAVRVVPFDPHLEEGAEIALDRLRRETREALTELAAVVAAGFPGDPRRCKPSFT